MELKNIVEIETKWGYKSIELYQGDITLLETVVDTLVVSAFASKYEPTKGTVIGALDVNANISVKDLSKNIELDLREPLGCWISKPVLHERIKRILCVEMIGRDFSICEVFENIFVVLALMDLKNIHTRTMALPVLGTGNQRIKPEIIIKPLINCAVRYMKHSENLEKILFVAYNQMDATRLDKAINELLARDILVLPKSKLVDGVKNEITVSIDRIMSRNNKIKPDTLIWLRRVISADRLVYFEVAIAARRLVELIVDDILQGNTQYELWKKIDKLSEYGIAPWIRSYMHLIRIFGNESAHEKSADKRLPMRINDGDFALCLFCIQRLLDFFADYRNKTG